MYLSSNISFFNSIEELASQEQPQSDAHLLVLCHSGQLLLETTVTYRLAAGDMLLCPAGWNINKFFASHDFKGDFYIFRKQVIDDIALHIIHTNNNLWIHYRFLREHPVLHLNGRQLHIYGLLAELHQLLMEDEHNLYRDNIVNMLLQLGVYEMLNWLDTKMPVKEQSAVPTPRMSRKDQITGDFVRLVVEQKGMQREVRWYADQLCVTPKYLAVCVREKMARTPHEYINDVLMTEIRQLLQQTDLTAQQIAHRLGFTSQSFFGKFVRSHTGMSPLALREYLRNKDRV